MKFVETYFFSQTAMILVSDVWKMMKKKGLCLNLSMQEFEKKVASLSEHQVDFMNDKMIRTFKLGP